VDIPKPSGGNRTLGVPTVVDRLVQQALHQVLQPLFEPVFSEGSYGFRPGRSAQQGVQQAQAYICDGKRWPSVVNVSQLLTLDRELLTQRVRGLPADTMRQIDEGLRLALGV
jgi:RNA-directed DNA polymerase